MDSNIQTPDILKSDYTFIRMLGEGTSGKTYLAKRNSDGLQVAVKVMKFALAENYKSYELFCREAEVMKSLNIPGVPRVFECQAGDTSSLSYIVQEYIEYPSLQTIIKERGKLDERQTLQILEKLAEIICQLQTNYVPPVIHRDIKPSNVLCDLDGEDIKVSLIDFGAVANPQKRSEKSTVAGTFGYMAPEQMLNDVVIQSDYYAMGALAAHLLTGMEPYEMESQGSAFEIDYTGAIQAHAPETSQAMIMLIGHLLEPAACNRPINAIALLDEIRLVKSGELPQASLEKRGSLFIAVLKKIGSWLKKLQPRPKMVKISKTYWSEWPKVHGVVRSVFRHNDKQYVEYTFDANDRTWCGGSCIGTKRADAAFLNPPCSCLIRYNPDNPRFNSLIDYEQSDKEKTAAK